LKTNTAENNRQTQVRYRVKIGFIASVTLMTAFLSALVSNSLLHQKPPINNLASFTCGLASSNQTFTIDVEVDLKDGMDQNEAIRVAAKAFNKATESCPPFELARCSDALMLGFDLDACTLEGGIWTVRLHLVHINLDYEGLARTQDLTRRRATGTRLLHEYFELVINPFDQTIVYRF